MIASVKVTFIKSDSLKKNEINDGEKTVNWKKAIKIP